MATLSLVPTRLWECRQSDLEHVPLGNGMGRFRSTKGGNTEVKRGSPNKDVYVDRIFRMIQGIQQLDPSIPYTIPTSYWKQEIDTLQEEIKVRIKEIRETHPADKSRIDKFERLVDELCSVKTLVWIGDFLVALLVEHNVTGWMTLAKDRFAVLDLDEISLQAMDALRRFAEQEALGTLPSFDLPGSLMLDPVSNHKDADTVTSNTPLAFSGADTNQSGPLAHRAFDTRDDSEDVFMLSPRQNSSHISPYRAPASRRKTHAPPPAANYSPASYSSMRQARQSEPSQPVVCIGIDYGTAMCSCYVHITQPNGTILKSDVFTAYRGHDDKEFSTVQNWPLNKDGLRTLQWGKSVETELLSPERRVREEDVIRSLKLACHKDTAGVEGQQARILQKLESLGLSLQVALSTQFKELYECIFEYIGRIRVISDAGGISKADLKVAIAVPADWKSSETEIIREAALQGPVKWSNLTLAIETDALAISYFALAENSDGQRQRIAAVPGGHAVLDEGMLLVDGGGGTVCFAALSISQMSPVRFRELARSQSKSYLQV